MPAEPLPSALYQDIQSGIVLLLESARTAVARSVNSLMTASYWEIGRRIVAFEQGGEERAGYGEALIPRLAKDLTRRFGRGFGWRNLTQMRNFFLSWPSEAILQTVSAKFDPSALVSRFPLPWSAYVRLLSVRSPEARSFYEREALRGGWSVRQLDQQIDSMLYEGVCKITLWLDNLFINLAGWKYRSGWLNPPDCHSRSSCRGETKKKIRHRVRRGTEAEEN